MKWAILAAAVFMVCYPDPRLFWRHWTHFRNPNALVDPHAERLQPLVREVRAAVGDVTDPARVLTIVERYVYQRVPYAFDWETWGVCEYLPTVDEVLDMDREDCDGRAVVAASLLRNLGYRAELVADFAHMWVNTDQGETMSPGKHQAVRLTERGIEVDWGWPLVGTLSNAAGFGLAVFPLPREMIVLAVVWLLLLHPRTGWRAAAVAAVLMVNGLLLIREGSESHLFPQRALQAFGLAQLVAGVVLLWRSSEPRGLSPRSHDGQSPVAREGARR